MGYSLETSVAELKGIGPARAEALAEHSIRTLRDLLLHFPKRYLVRLRARAISSLQAGEAGEAGVQVAIEGRVLSVRSRRQGRRAVVRIRVEDASGSIEVLFFNQYHLRRNFQRGEVWFFQGRVGRRGEQLSLLASFHERATGDSQEPVRIPVYDLPEGFPPRLHRRLLAGLLEGPDLDVPDWRGSFVLPAAGLDPLGRVVRMLHRPGSAEVLMSATRRLAYEEFFRILLPLEQARARLRRRHKLRPTRLAPGERGRLEAALPFALTGAQGVALDQLLADLARPAPMHRLLHGDVGSGKTVVALLALAACARAGHQAALLVPTEVLVRQHHRNVEPFLRDLGIDVVVLTGSTRAAPRRESLERLSSGAACVVMGTHALLTASVRIPALALAVVDEQHRFGVSQRARLRSKAEDVDLLVMTATPIPRSLAMTLYGDLDLCVLDELPPGRLPVRTERISADEVPALLDRIRADALRGERIFIVCPLVEASQDGDLAAAVGLARTLAQRFNGRPGVGLAHGRRTADQNREALDDFQSGLRPVLVATVVIEVGVDVPEATMMVVLDAQRFGLAALHQLRGRVGRGSRESRCVLVSNDRNPNLAARLDVLVEESSGFRVAERDLELRGAGELYGARQHGLLDFAHADLIRDLDLLARAREDARRVVGSGRCADLDGGLPIHGGRKPGVGSVAGPG